MSSSDVGQHRCEDLEPEVPFVPKAMGPALDHPDLVGQPLDEVEGDLALREAVSGDPLTERSSPPNQMGRRTSRSLTIMLQVWPLREEFYSND
jgi:hypothetical protein